MAKVRKLFKFHKSTTDLSEWNKNDDKLLKAVERGEVEKVETLLNKKTLMPTKPGPKGLSVFHWAALSGQLAIIEIFLAHGVDINATDLLGHTALHLAAKYGWPQMVEKLLQLGVNKHARDSDHMTALHHACGSGHPACVRALLLQGGGANDKDKSGRTALFYCGQSGDVGMCKWLLDHGADPNIQDMLGRTALIFAAVKGHRDVCELLLKRGADPDCRDKDGLKAVEYAIRCDHDIKDLFDQAPARASWDVNAEPGASNDTDGTQSTLFNDIVRQFSGENSPVPKERKSKQVQSAALSSQASSHSGKTNKQSSDTKGQTTEEAYKELEEEHEVLTEELRVLRIAHIKLKDKVEFLTDRSANKAPADYGKEDNEKIQAIENEMKKIQMLYSTEKDKNAELEHKVERLQEKLRCESKTDSPGITDNWGDSDDELFGGPLDKRPNEKTNAENEQQLILLKSQILTLQQENDHLKEKLQ